MPLSRACRSSPNLRWLMLYVLVGSGCLSCGSDSSQAGPPVLEDLTEAMFASDRVLEVAIRTTEEDWDAIRSEGRSLVDILSGSCIASPFPSPFSWVPAEVTVDGETVGMVGLRKKGFYGSLDDDKPSLKLKFDRYVPLQTLSGLSRMTLNNSLQDPSYVRQCISYQVFKEAGVPAPRCNFARVNVNGRDLGLYVHVESIKKPFLARHFDDPDGNLYEGTLSDFRPGWTGTFEKKTDPGRPAGDDIAALVTAAGVPDQDLSAALDPLVDMDEFFRFWATEVLIGHADGYAGNTSNYYVYREAGGKFLFLPWGADTSLSAPPGQRVAAIFATGVLPFRLYAIPATQQRYLDTLRTLLDSAWDEAQLDAEITRMEELFMPILDDDELAAQRASAAAVRSFIAERRNHIIERIDGGPPVFNRPLRDPPCLKELGFLEGTFSTTFGTLSEPNPFSTGSGTLTATVPGSSFEVQFVGAKAGIDPSPSSEGWVEVEMSAQLADGTLGGVRLQVPPAEFVAGEPIQVDFRDARGFHFRFDPSSGDGGLVGLLLGGTLQLEEAGTATRAPVVGSFSATLVENFFSF